MSLREELESQVQGFVEFAWDERDGRQVPDDSSLTFKNEAIKLDATVLYADMADSTDLVDRYEPYFAAEVYKSFLHCSAKIIKSCGGEVTAYDGDRVMAVFIGDSKNSSAAKAALKISWAVSEIIRPTFKKQYPNSDFSLRHVVGIDTSELFVAKTGVRGANDLVWVGRAANHAAKMASLPDNYQTYISASVYKVLAPYAKLSEGRDMWETYRWDELDGRTVYRSTYYWTVD